MVSVAFTGEGEGDYPLTTGRDAVAYNAPCSPQTNHTPLARGCNKDASTQTKALATSSCFSVLYDRFLQHSLSPSFYTTPV